MNYYTTLGVAHLCRVSPATLRRWRAVGHIKYPYGIRLMTAAGKWVRFYIWTKPDALPVIRFAEKWRAERVERERENRRRAKRMEPEVKAERAVLRRQMRAVERLIHVVRWFEHNPLSSKIYRAWSVAEKELATAGLLDAKSKLAPGAVEGLEARLTELKTAYSKLPGRLTGYRVKKLGSPKRRRRMQRGDQGNKQCAPEESVIPESG